jgi:hypothetical protein
MFRSRGKWSVKENLPAFGQRVDASFLAGLVGMTRQHMTRLCRTGKIPSAYQSTGGHWRFRWSIELDEWVQQLAPKPEEPRDGADASYLLAKAWREHQQLESSWSETRRVFNRKLRASKARLEMLVTKGLS